MIYALRGEDSKAIAKPRARAVCPNCEAAVIAKCGEFVRWHWAHRPGVPRCDSWAEHETAWHLSWKSIVQPAFCEVRIKPHIADIVGDHEGRPVVVEVQHSKIKPDTIREREAFYVEHVGQMVWVFDASSFLQNLTLEHVWSRRRDHSGPGAVVFDWRHMWRSHRAFRQPLYWDMGDGYMLQVHRLPDSGSYYFGERGWATACTRADFIQRYIGSRVLVGELAAFTETKWPMTAYGLHPAGTEPAFSDVLGRGVPLRVKTVQGPHLSAHSNTPTVIVSFVVEDLVAVTPFWRHRARGAVLRWYPTQGSGLVYIHQLIKACYPDFEFGSREPFNANELIGRSFVADLLLHRYQGHEYLRPDNLRPSE